jgi:translocation and assembly module TamB
VKIKAVLCIIGIFLALAAAALAFLGFSTNGLLVSIRTAGRVLPGTLSVSSAQGRLADTLRLTGVHYRDGNVEVAISDFTLSWRPAALLKMTLDISSLAMSRVSVRLPPQETDSPPSLFLPLGIRIESAAVNSLDLFFPEDSAPVHIAGVKLENASGGGTRLQFAGLEVTAPAYQLTIGGEVETGDAVRGRFTVDCSLTLQDYFPLAGRAEIEGDAERLNFTMQVRQPFQGTLKGTATGPTETVRWEAELESDQVRLAEIGRDWPEFVLTRFKAAGSGTMADYSLLAEADADYGPFQNIQVRTAIDGDAYGLKLSDTQLQLADETLRGHGILAWRDAFSWQAELAGKQVTLSHLDPAWPEAVLANVTLSGNGVEDTYVLELETEAAYGYLQDMHARGVIEGNADGLRFKDTRLDLAEGVLTAEGQLDWLEAFSWQATVNGTAINPAAWQPQWPGLLQFQAQSAGRLENDTLRGQVDLVSLDGRLRGYPVQGSGRMELAGDRLAIDRLALQVAGSTLLVSGQYADTVDIDFALQAGDLATLWPDASGTIRAKGRLAGKRPHPGLRFNLTGDTIAVADVKLGSVTAEAEGNLAADGSLQARVKATEVIVADTLVEDIEAELQGTTASHRLRLDGRAGTDSLSLQLAGGIFGSSWQGTLDRADLNQGNLGKWHLDEPATISVSAQSVDVDQLCLAGIDPARVCLAGRSDPEGLWQTEARFDSIPLQLLQLAQLRSAALDGVFSGVLALAGGRAGIGNGTLELATGDASMMLMIPEQNSRRITWRRNTLRAELADRQVTATLYSLLSDGSTLESSLQLHEVQAFPLSLAQAQVDGSIAFDIKEVQPLAMFTYPAADPSGALQGELSLRGAVASPTVSGTAHLLAGKMSVPPLGIALEGLEMVVTGKPPDYRVRVAGTSGNGPLLAEGTLLLADPADPKLTFNVRGERFEAVSLPEFKAIVTPDLQGTLTRKGGEVSGTILVPEAIIAPRDLAGAVSPSKDMVIIDPRSEPRSTGWPLSAHVSVIAGDNVRVDAFGLKGKVQGRLEVADLPGKPVTGDGILSVADGTFSIYGRELTIKVGRLLYSGNPIDNPGVDVRAEHTSREVTTGIQVTGFLNEPDISFYSTPPMEENAIIARLMLNTSLLGSSDQEKGFLGSVASRAGLDPVTSTVRGVKESLRLDDVKFETGKKSDDLSLVIGTWLTPDLYISYGQNLLKESGSFNTRYLLGHGFSVQTESGATQSGADLKYEIDR